MRFSLGFSNLVLGAFFSMVFFSQAHAQTTLSPNISLNAHSQAKSVAQLKEEIDTIRMQTNTPGLAVGVFSTTGGNKSEQIWQFYSGFSDLESRQIMSEKTQFRFGSISKMLVAMAILKLVESGDISLQDKLRDLAPEIDFTNPWQSTHPLRVVHLLNHSSAWDSPHFSEHIALSNTPVSIIEALRQHPASRESRWPPGTRIAYNNTGFLVAAYLVEKLSGISYEAYVGQTFFKPLNMKNSGYYFSDKYRNFAASLYVGKNAQPYAHLNNRAAGALNSNIGDMLKLVQLLAKESNPKVADSHLLKRLRTPFGTKAAQSGVAFTWGLGNQVFHANGIPLYGHEGSLRGANAILIYNPEFQFGYVIASTSNSPAVAKVHALLSDYLTSDLKLSTKMSSVTGGAISANEVLNNELATNMLNPKDAPKDTPKHTPVSAWYKNAAPISAKFSMTQTMIPWRLKIEGETASIKPLLGGSARQLVATGNNTFAHNTTGLVVLAAGQDELLDDVIFYGPNTFVKTHAIAALTPLFVIVFWLLMSVSGLIFLLIWLPRQLMKKSISAASIRYRLWPLLTLSTAILTILCARSIAASPNMFALLGNISIPAIVIFAGTSLFFLLSSWSVWVLYKQRHLTLNSFTKWHSGLFALANFGLAILLLSEGLIAVRVWV